MELEQTIHSINVQSDSAGIGLHLVYDDMIVIKTFTDLIFKVYFNNCLEHDFYIQPVHNNVCKFRSTPLCFCLACTMSPHF